MVKNRVFIPILIFLLVSYALNASLAFSLRKLIASEPSNVSPNSQVSPVGSPVDQSNAQPINETKSNEETNKESQMTSQNYNNDDNKTLPIDPKGAEKNDSDNKTSGAPAPHDDTKNGNKADKENNKGVDPTTQQLGDNGSCNGSLTSCRDKEMIACIEPKQDGSERLFLVVVNSGESTLKVDVNLPNSFGNALPTFEVPKHEIRRVDLLSTVGNSKEIIVNSGNVKCVVPLVNRVSVDYFMQQFTFYSRQVTPIFAAYAFFLFMLLFGGTWACCKLRKRRENGIPYQELEMGLPESSSAVNVDATEGWDHDWDDDWDEDDAVQSPGGQQVSRNISADGLTARTVKKDGWENDWDD